MKEMFSRIELKYLIPYADYLAIAEAIAPRMRTDRFGGRTGRYKITTLYFDSPDHRIYFETVNRLPIRQKLRLRIYAPEDHAAVRTFEGLEQHAFFELKQKAGPRVNKRRTLIRLKDAYRFIDNPQTALAPLQPSNEQVMREIARFRGLYHLSPRVIVEYRRQAFEGIDDPDLRITFDYELACRHGDLRLESGAAAVPFVDPLLVILEVKVSGSVPLWLARLLSDYRCERRSVSKYCTSVDTVCPISDTIAARRSFFNPTVGGTAHGAIADVL